MLKNTAATPTLGRLGASQEAYVLDRCRGHPCIVQLLDTFLEDSPFRRYSLLFELWGKDLIE